MTALNRVLLIGNLTRDPEMRYTPSGMAVCRVGVAVNRRFKDSKTNEMREETTFVDVDVWGRQAETANQYLAKGRPVFIEGRLKLDQWEDKQTGQRRSKLGVVCERWQFVGSSGQGGGAPTQNRRATAPAAQAGSAPDNMEPPLDQEPEDLQPPEDQVPF
jgi:single-strand DNA-binding protein